ncbi:MAG: DUF3127 domain-containing protein [Bacteroidetes bacterium]|jgi:translation initiation factor IF-3|nr:DUF3127 domain-containing protein [Bacteroidota bacterium]
MLQVTGTLKVKYDTKNVSEKFRKREFVISIDEKSAYPQTILMQLTQDKCALLDNIKEGEQITVNFNLKGREWKSPQGEIKFFNSIDAWRLERATSDAPVSSDNDIPFSSAPELPQEEYKDDLPF